MKGFSFGPISRKITRLAVVLVALTALVGPVSAQDSDGAEMPVHQVNINTGDAATLALALDGVGEARAEAIVAYRDENGPFQRVEDLQQVSGIGPATLERNRERLQVEGAED